MGDRAVEFQAFDIGNFTLSIGDLLIFNDHVCYILKIVVSGYRGQIHLTVSVPGNKNGNKLLTFQIAKFLYQLEDGKFRLIHAKKVT